MTLDIAKARALCEAATPEPWLTDDENLDNAWMVSPTPNTLSDHTIIMDCAISEPEDLAFIAAARTLLPAALDEVERLRARVAELEGALFFYANPDNYFAVAILGDRPCGEFADDYGETETELGIRHGKRAREALRWFEDDH